MRRTTVYWLSVGLLVVLAAGSWWRAPVLRASAPGFASQWTGGDLVSYWYAHNRLAGVSGADRLWTPSQVASQFTRQAWLAVLAPQPPEDLAPLESAYPGLWRGIEGHIGSERMARLIRLPALRQKALRHTYAVTRALPASELLARAREHGLVEAAQSAGLALRPIQLGQQPEGAGPIWLLQDGEHFFVADQLARQAQGFTLRAAVLPAETPDAWLARQQAAHPLQWQRTWFGLF